MNTTKLRKGAAVLRRRIVAILSAVLLGLLVQAPTSAVAPPTSPWEPVPDSDDYSVAACRTTLTVSEVVNDVESRTTTLRDGTVRTDYRGKYVVRVSTLDRRGVTLDNSGPYSVLERPNGDLAADIGAPSLIAYLDETEKAAFARAGLPPVFYYRQGRLKLFIDGESGSERVVSRPERVVNVCDLLRR